MRAAGGFRTTPLAGVLARIWATFLILSFNVASLNTLTGWAIDWFKPVWATLSTFGFATTAYVTNLWFFVPAVQMYFTGLAMALFPNDSYLIYGMSWWATLPGNRPGSRTQATPADEVLYQSTPTKRKPLQPRRESGRRRDYRRAERSG